MATIHTDRVTTENSAASGLMLGVVIIGIILLLALYYGIYGGPNGSNNNYNQVAPGNPTSTVQPTQMVTPTGDDTRINIDLNGQEGDRREPSATSQPTNGPTQAMSPSAAPTQ